MRKGKVSESEIEYLNAEQEDEYIIAQANVPLDEKNRFKTDRVTSRHRGDFVVHPPDDIQYMDVAPKQIVSAAAALIPFLEHDDANRALMGSNMQRQSVPLLRPDAPIVGTGLEEMVARDSRTCVIAERAGVVENVSGDRIIVVYDIDETNTEALVSFDDKRRVEYHLTKFFRTNQDTCINQKAIVVPGQRFKKGEVLADGCATDHGELALGRNVLVAFMPWRGYNFEDAIIMNERIVSEDVYTSIHIEEFELQVRDTKRGEEELTREIPNVSEEATKDLDENGIIRVGAEVKEGDILIGKITPKGETDPTPEEKLLKAIFGEKAGDVKDASLKAPPGMKGIVIETKLFSRKKKDAETKKEDKKHLDLLEKQRRKDIKDHYEKLGRKLDLLLSEEKSIGVRDKDGNVVSGAERSSKKGRSRRTTTSRSSISRRTGSMTSGRTISSSASSKTISTRSTTSKKRTSTKRTRSCSATNCPPGIVQLAKVYVAKKRKLSVGDKMAGRHGNKGVVAAIVPREDMPFMPDGTPVDIVLNPLGVPSRMNLGQLFETALGWAGKALGMKFSTPIFDGASWEDVQAQLDESGPASRIAQRSV